MKKSKTLLELFSFPGFVAKNQLEGKFGDPKVRIIELQRKKKWLSVLCADVATAVIMIRKFVMYVTVMRKVIKFIFNMREDEYFVRNVTVSTWKH